LDDFFGDSAAARRRFGLSLKKGTILEYAIGHAIGPKRRRAAALQKIPQLLWLDPQNECADGDLLVGEDFRGLFAWQLSSIQ